MIEHIKLANKAIKMSPIVIGELEPKLIVLDDIKSPKDKVFVLSISHKIFLTNF